MAGSDGPGSLVIFAGSACGPGVSYNQPNNLHIYCFINGRTSGGISGGISPVIFVLVDLSMRLLKYVICLIHKMF